MKYAGGYGSMVAHAGRLALLLSLMPLASGSAEIYKWTDANGRIHYGDHPGAERAVPVTTVRSPHPDPQLEKRQQQQQRLLKILSEDRQKQQQLKRDEKAVAEGRQANCDKARQRLSQMRDSSYLYEKTADPDNPRILSTNEYNAAIASAGRDVQIWCIKTDKSVDR